MRTSDAIHTDIHNRFEDMTDKKIQGGSVIDFYTVAVSKVVEGVYEEIEESKNPHLYSSLSGQNLDDTGFFVNLPRRVGEDDEQYRYRLMNWTYSAESSNTTAISDALLNLEYASDADYIPLTNGAGTASVFIIPRNYEEETVKNALEEVKARLKKKASPSLYIEYIVPEIKPVKLHLSMSTAGGDINQIQANLHEAIKRYVNSIEPKNTLKIGSISRLGINEPMVSYFDVLQVFIDNKEVKTIEIVQNIESKFILDEIIWS